MWATIKKKESWRKSQRMKEIKKRISQTKNQTLLPQKKYKEEIEEKNGSETRRENGKANKKKKKT